MAVATDSPAFSKDNPFPARLVENRILNGRGSAKETRHLVVDIGGSGLSYATGDSLGVFPSNDPVLVDEIIMRLGVSGDVRVSLPRVGQPITTPLRDALLSKLSLSTPTRKTIELLASAAADATEKETLTSWLAPEHKERLMVFLGEREHVDLLAEFPSARPTPQGFVEQLRRLVPRLYSIASSPRLHPTDVHLTVAVVRYRTNDRLRKGVCSTYLAERVETRSTPVPVFVAPSHFGVPDNDATDIIMVGPGTGVAPFRAFLQERAARKAPGRNWLFFGDQHRATDFLYADEFEAMQRAGTLTRLDTAFSRDQTRKVYVQDRMREAGAELWSWLQGGASFFVCGDAKRMAKDVDVALHELVHHHGGMDAAQAAEFVKTLRQTKRYQRDVY